MNTHKHVFIRQDGQDVDAVAILLIQDNDGNRGAAAGLQAVERAITRWVKETPEGREAYEESSEDYNIGDFVDDYQSESLAAYLIKEGIAGLDLTTLCPDETNTYDHHLVDDEELYRF